MDSNRDYLVIRHYQKVGNGFFPYSRVRFRPAESADRSQPAVVEHKDMVRVALVMPPFDKRHIPALKWRESADRAVRDEYPGSVIHFKYWE